MEPCTHGQRHDFPDWQYTSAVVGYEQYRYCRKCNHLDTRFSERPFPDYPVPNMQPNLQAEAPAIDMSPEIPPCDGTHGDDAVCPSCERDEAINNATLHHHRTNEGVL